MKQIRCSLCDGLILNGRCTSCGMYYREKEGRYYLNERRPESKRKDVSQPASRVAQERKETMRKPAPPGGIPPKDQKKETLDYKRKMKELTPQDKNGKSKLSLILPVVFIAIVLINEIMDNLEFYQISGEPEGYYVAEEEEADPYKYVTMDMPEEGEFYETELTAGTYIVGIHIPMGVYNVTTMDEVGQYFLLNDETNNIYNYWWAYDYKEGEEYYRIPDIRLYQGAVLCIDGGGSLIFTTETAQMDILEVPQENPLTEEVVLSDEPLIAGIDFEPGVYDAAAMSGRGDLFIVEDQYSESYHYLSAENSWETGSYKNIKLEEGMQVCVEAYGEEECEMRLLPSEMTY